MPTATLTRLFPASPAVSDHAVFDHRPVMLADVVELFSGVPEGTIIDATLGGGGHSDALLAASSHRRVIGIDRDADALEAAGARLTAYGQRFSPLAARFDDGLRIIAESGHSEDSPIVGVFFDLGVSSPQLDRADRGFSYRNDAPLDMRMDPTSGPSAAEVVNTYGVDELARVLREYGDERFAHRVARAIVDARPVTRTTELAEIVRAAIPAATRRRGGHPAKRTFQALRIEVNGELQALESALSSALDLVTVGGRVAAISYHSGEDRRVKQAFRFAVDGGCTCPPGLPCVCGAVVIGRNITRGGITPGDDEKAANPRAASARLRAVEIVS